MNLGYIKYGVDKGAGEKQEVSNTRFRYATIQNDAELLKFIQDTRGKGCGSFIKKPLDNTGSIFNIEIKRTDSFGGCFVNYAYGFLYSPQKKTAVTWMLGQEPPWQTPGQGYFPLKVSILE